VKYRGRAEHTIKELELLVEYQLEKIEYLDGKNRSLQNLLNELTKEILKIIKEKHETTV